MVKQRYDCRQCYRTVLQSVTVMSRWFHTCNRCPWHVVPMRSFSFRDPSFVDCLPCLRRRLFTFLTTLLSHGLLSSDSAWKAASSSAYTGDVKCVWPVYVSGSMVQVHLANLLWIERRSNLPAVDHGHRQGQRHQLYAHTVPFQSETERINGTRAYILGQMYSTHPQ